VTSEWEQLRAKLAAEGVSGTEDLGRFVRNVEHFRPSTFDERAAMPVLMRELARLTDPKLVSAGAGHLARGWARPDAFIPLREAFIRWAEADAVTGWHIGDALASQPRRISSTICSHFASSVATEWPDRCWSWRSVDFVPIRAWLTPFGPLPRTRTWRFMP
jgi:hypothetical protein